MKKGLLFGVSTLCVLLLAGCGSDPKVPELEDENIVISEDALIDETITEVEGLLDDAMLETEVLISETETSIGGLIGEVETSIEDAVVLIEDEIVSDLNDAFAEIGGIFANL